jgi:hypothetical protein
MPLEVEIYRSFRHTMIGKRLRKKIGSDAGTSDWYRKAQALVEEEMQEIADNAQGGQIDATVLGPEAAEMLQLYIDNQVRVTSVGNVETILSSKGRAIVPAQSSIFHLHSTRKHGKRFV